MNTKKLWLTTTAICCLAAYIPTAHAAIEVGTWAALKNAITSGREPDIILTGNIVVNANTSLSINRNINLSSKGDNKFTISAAKRVTFSKAFIHNIFGRKLTLSNVELNGFNNKSTGYYGGAIYYNSGETSSITGSAFAGNIAGSSGGAIYNWGTIETLSATFENNTARVKDPYEGGGAIFNSNGGTINLVADAADSSDNLLDEVWFKGNTAASGKGNGIYNEGVLIFIGNNNGAFAFYDDIYSSGDGTIAFAGDGTGTFNLFNDIGGRGVLNFNASYDFNMVNNEINTVKASKIKIKASSNLYLDADLSGYGSIDHFVGATNVANDDALFTLKDLNILNDMDDGVVGIKLAVADGSMLKTGSSTIVTSGGVYEYSTDDRNVQITRTSNEGGFSRFVSGMINLPDERAYSYTQDEEMKLIYGNGTDITSIVSGAAANLTVNGNGKTLTGTGGSAMELAIGQKATIKNLTVKGFKTAIKNKGEVSLVASIFEGNTDSAILNEGTLGITADSTGDVLFKDNVATSGQGAAIYNTGDLTFTGNNNGAFAFYDDIYSEGGTMTFAGDGTGKFNLFNDIKGTGNITFNSDYAFNMLNDVVNVIHGDTLTLNSTIKMAVDVDLANATMDSFVASSAAGTGEIIINNMNLISEATADKTIIPFITAGTNNTAVSSAISKIDTGSLTHYYNVSYADGNFTFDKMQRESNEVAEDVGVPAVSSGVQQTQSALNSLLANREIYASLGLASGDTTRPTTWAKAFGSKDSVEMKHSYNSIDTQFYGVVGGVDSRTFIYDNGVNAVYGIYAAYMGSNQKQNSVKVTQDGGYLGVSADLNKNGVFSRFTAHGGYIANEAKTAWGNDKFDIWTASVSNKTGYEINFGEYTLKPALYASYMYINTENYTSKSGAKLKNHTKNVFEVTPEVKLAKDFGTGLEGYAKVAYTWNFYQGGKVTADDVLLPKMSVKPYVEYGVGLEKDWSEEEWNPKDITSYAEINRHDGGRTGWDINAGLKFQF